MQGKNRHMQTIQISDFDYLFQLCQIALLKVFMMPRDFRHHQQHGNRRQAHHRSHPE